jgi:phosphate transport system substrate-binding protein
MTKTPLAAALALAAASLSAQALARDAINIVGSSTVFPFSTAVAENFGRRGKFKTPRSSPPAPAAGSSCSAPAPASITPTSPTPRAP